MLEVRTLIEGERRWSAGDIHSDVGAASQADEQVDVIWITRDDRHCTHVAALLGHRHDLGIGGRYVGWLHEELKQPVQAGKGVRRSSRSPRPYQVGSRAPVRESARSAGPVVSYRWAGS